MFRSSESKYIFNFDLLVYLSSRLYIIGKTDDQGI